jgi:sigma-B regulation protein RsbU (phosphoserine phosphatase)
VLERFEKIRLDRELTMASTVQQRLMARRHSSGSAFDVVGSSLPCRAIGGDFVEFVDLPTGAIWMALGDVSGKGPAAALVAAMLQGMFAMVATDVATPESVLARLNTALHQRGIAPGYATLFCGKLTPDGLLHYSNAGHAPPLLVTGPSPKVLGAGGPILGVFEGASFPSEVVGVPPRATLLAYSDGVTEAARADGLDFGVDRLIAAAAGPEGEPLPQVVDRIVEAIREFCGTAPLLDDVTIVAARRK